MWFDIFIYSFSIITTVISGLILRRTIKPQTAWYKFLVWLAAVLCGCMAFMIVILGAIIVILMRLTV